MRKFFFKLKLLLKGLLYRRLRLFVALAAVACGAAMLLALLAIFIDVPRQYGKEFSNYGANFLIRPLAAGTNITEEELTQLKDFLQAELPKENVVALAPYAYRKVKINEQPFILALTDLEAAHKNSPYWLIEGEMAQGKEELLLGAEVGNLLNKGLKDEVIISLTNGDQKSMEEREVKAARYLVSGIIRTGGKEENLIYADVAAFSKLSKEAVLYDVLECSLIADSKSLQNLAHRVESVFPNVQAQLTKRLTTSKDLVLSKLQVLILLVSVIIIALTFVSVTTTMLALINERRVEIALHKALGASDREVQEKFVLEAVILGLIGGCAGSYFAYKAAGYISVRAFARHLEFPFVLVPAGLVIAVALTAAAVLIPIKQISGIEAAVVLKGE